MWVSAKTPPLFESTDPWLCSQKVFVVTKLKTQHLATFEQIDEDSPPVWLTACSSRWNLKDVVAWHPAPSIPENLDQFL